MNAPVQAVLALIWAIVGPPILVYGGTRVRAGNVRLHRGVMLGAVALELATLVGFLLLMERSPRRPALMALPIFRIHLAFAVATLVGIGWQLVSRVVPRLRPAHRHSGPYVLLVRCLALLTRIYNYVFLYVMR
jgi:uncharacterized membrane protein YozB (DUF420 family)